MLGLPWPSRRRAARLTPGRAVAALYGHALYLPPSSLPARVYPKGHEVVVGLRPFRSRLHRQRAAATVLRALILATLVAMLILLIRALGFAVPVPAAPLIGAGGVLLLSLAAIAWERPTPGEMAHEIDRGLNLHEQIGSALELDEAPQGRGRLGDLLWQRATATLREANPVYVLPARSLQRERRVLLGLLCVAAILALVAVHAPLRRFSPSPAQASSVLGRHAGTRGASGHGAVAVTLRTIGAATHIQRATTPHGARGTAGTRQLGVGSTGHGGKGHLLVGKGAALQSGQVGHGTHGSNPGNGAQTGTPGQNGRAGGHTGTLRLGSGQNSSTGGVSSPQQQALQNLQNSITSASKQSSPSGQSRLSNGATSGQDTQGGSGGRQGQNGRSRNGQGRQGHFNNGTSGQHGRGANGGHGRQSTSGQGQGTAQGQGDSPLHNGRRGGAGDPSLDGRALRPGGGGADLGANTGPKGGSATGQAQLGNGGSVALNGATGGAGPLIMSIGPPNRGSGAIGLGDAPSGLPNNALIGVPGYVAPDSNAITPDDRAVVRGYFSPPPNG